MLYPMKRVDFDPNGERNPQNRGKSGYERISWDEALDIVADEIRRQKRDAWSRRHHHLDVARITLGKYRLLPQRPDCASSIWSALTRMARTIRTAGRAGTGARCITGATASASASQATTARWRTACRMPSMIVFWSSDPESTNGAYGGLREHAAPACGRAKLGINSSTSIPITTPRRSCFGGQLDSASGPATDAALAIAIMYVWIKEGLYDKDYVRTTHDRVRRVARLCDGRRRTASPKTPEWQEPETGVPAKDVRALARLWAKKKTYLSCGMSGAGFGGAGRGADRSAMGALHGHADGDARSREAGHQHGRSAVRRAGRPRILFPRLCRWRHIGRAAVDRQCRQQLSAHAACSRA